MEVARLVIVAYDDRPLEVTGPLPNKGLCYQMLEMARDVIKDYGDAQARGPKLEIPRLVPPADVAGNGGRLPKTG